MLVVAGGNRNEVGDTQRQHTFSGTADAGTSEIQVENGRVGTCQTLTWIVSRLVGNLGCVKSWVMLRMVGSFFVRNSRAAAGSPQG